jgi:hypothetical protein
MALLVLGFAGLIVGGLWAIDQSHSTADRFCQSSVENRKGLRTTWLAAQEYILKGQPKEQARVKTKEFFAEVLKEIPPLECVDRKPMEVQR